MSIAETIYQHVKALSKDQALEVLHFVEFLEAKRRREAKPLPNTAETQAEHDFFSEAGLWQNRDISQEMIRAQGWRHESK